MNSTPTDIRRYFEYEGQPNWPDIYSVDPDSDGDLILAHECAQGGWPPDRERPRPVTVELHDGIKKADAIRILTKIIQRIRRHPETVMSVFRPEPEPAGLEEVF